jgi:uncharacterized repeat protein (TIGR01451 family)
MRVFIPSRQWLRRGLFGLIGLLISVSLWGFVAAGQAQEVTITNTATAGFADGAGVPQPVLTSNSTTVRATVNPSELVIIKTGDRASAEPGDSVVYRILVQNTGQTVITDLQVVDTLPFGTKYLANSGRAALAGVPVNFAAPPNQNGRTLTFSPVATLNPGQTLTLTYAVVLTPDAIRGNGRNLAVANGNAGGLPVVSNPATFVLAIRPGILADCGTIIGRVFVDKNFDGEQQPGEPGVPNAVIYFDDGNRVTTDSEGLFSLAYVVAGTRTATLDLTSLPGYTIAPNLYRIEQNSTARMVKLSPGGLARMNFAVTPTFQEGQR